MSAISFFENDEKRVPRLYMKYDIKIEHQEIILGTMN
jgi:hypothetical protein